MIEQELLFVLPPAPRSGELALKRPTNPVWTRNKSLLIERYLRYFVYVTKHGTYIDGFAGPQRIDKEEMWSAKLVMESEPRRLRHLFLFELNAKKVKRLEKLAADQPPTKPAREIRVFRGDVNVELPKLLSTRPISEKEATFCLLDQRTFECDWATVEAVARYKTQGHKIEIFYFLAVGWIGRARNALKNPDATMGRWWNRSDWRKLMKMGQTELLDIFTERFKSELGYASAKGYGIYDKERGRKLMYYMIHATDHPEAQKLMMRAYNRAVLPVETEKQFLLEFDQFKEAVQKEG